MLKPGARVGALEVLGPLGAGGMGEVWRARDTRLGREVALKVLPDGLAADPDRLARLEREARLLAALNHPGIAAIHGLEQSDGMPLLVLELVEGPTLAERLRRGPLPLREALETGLQIAEALEAAHEKGIIHRDLKPSNIKLPPQGRVKLLDFGLAKALAAEAPADEVSNLSTDTSPTEAGVLMGTAPYMSPEQARREAVDRRVDVWGFGCVLYEMLTGRRAFPGRTLSDVIAVVLEREPDWSALPAATPAAVRALLRRCLQKDIVRRLHDIADVRIEIAEALAGSAVGDSSERTPQRWPRLFHVGAPLVAAVVTAGVVWGLMRVSPSPRPRRLNIQLPLDAPLNKVVDGPSLVALSPDGAHLVYKSNIAGGRRLHMRSLDELQSKPIPGTEHGYEPFFSPDGQWIGFAAEGKLKKVALAGGPPSVICDAPDVRGATWGADGAIIVGGVWTGLSRVAAEGGHVEALTTPDREKGEISHRWPQFLPGGEAVLFTIHALSGRQDEGRIAILSLDTGERHVLLQGGTYGRYVPTGHLVYARDGALFAAPFDVDRIQVTGPAVPVLENVRMSFGGTGVGQFSFSAAGQLVYVAGYEEAVETSLVWVDRRGNSQPATAARRAYGGMRLLPDGHSVVVSIAGGTTTDLWRLDLFREARTRLTFEKDSVFPVLSHDGGRVAFSSNRMGSYNLYLVPTTGGPAERLTSAREWQQPTGWSPDGKELVFGQQSATTGWDIWVVPLAGDRTPRPLVATEFTEGGAVFSPDGRWLAYASRESGAPEVYVRAYPGPDRKWQVSTEGGLNPVWARNGRELFYMSRGQLMAVSVDTRPEFRSGRPQFLFSAPYSESAGFNPAFYDVTPDGQRFLMLAEPKDLPDPQVVYIPDWFEELEARVPGGTGRWP